MSFPSILLVSLENPSTVPVIPTQAGMTFSCPGCRLPSDLCSQDFLCHLHVLPDLPDEGLLILKPPLFPDHLDEEYLQVLMIECASKIKQVHLHAHLPTGKCGLCANIAGPVYCLTPMHYFDRIDPLPRKGFIYGIDIGCWISKPHPPVVTRRHDSLNGIITA